MKKCEDFDKDVLECPGAVLADFYADWCGPCRLLIPVLEELSAEVPDVSFVKVDVEANPSAAAKYNVSSIPNLVLFKDGVQVASRVGGDSKDNIKNWIKENISK